MLSELIKVIFSCTYRKRDELVIVKLSSIELFSEGEIAK